MAEEPARPDNRSFDFSRLPVNTRPEYKAILDWVPEGARVVDLACGNGSLLDLLKKQRNVKEFGIELAPTGVEQCRAKGLNVRAGRVDVPLDDLADDAFDVAICSVTIMMVMYPETLLKEMKRVAPVQIVSFNNFGAIHNRLEALFSGRMPRRMLFGYTWYSTGHIHQLSLLDYLDLCRELDLEVVRVDHRHSKNPLLELIYRTFPNLFTTTATVMTRRRPQPPPGSP